MHDLELAKVRFWNAIWLKSDSMLVVLLLSSCSVSIPWKYQGRCLYCLDFSSNIDFRVLHILWEGNCVVNLLSKHALDISHSVLWSKFTNFL